VRQGNEHCLVRQPRAIDTGLRNTNDKPLDHGIRLDVDVDDDDDSIADDDV
jgi:hypothetical protein